MDVKFSLPKWRAQMGKAMKLPAPLSQPKAALLLQYSVSYIRKIEQGLKPLPRWMPDVCQNKLKIVVDSHKQ